MTLVYGAPLPRILVVQAETGGAHAEAAAVLQLELREEAAVEVITVEALAQARPAVPALVVTVGSAALERTLPWLESRAGEWRQVPLLATLLPQAVFEARRAQLGGRAFSAVVLDQPLARQLALIRHALPDHRRVGVLTGPQTQALLAPLAKEARHQGLQLVTAPAVTEATAIYPALREVLTASDVLLALPDTLVFNPGTVQNILLTTYRARVPVVAFSAAYVKAGALLALYATPAQVARQTAAAVRQWLSGHGLPPPRPPREFAVASNPHVAASLGLRLEDVELLAEELRRREGH